MVHPRVFLYPAGLMAATTIGAGIFALPFVFYEAGWLLSLVFLIVIAILIVFVHSLYWAVLEKFGERAHLLGLGARYFGALGKYGAFAVIVGGLVLTLVVYLILGRTLLELLFPALAPWGMLIFWLVSSLPIFFREKSFERSELMAGILMAFIILVIFGVALRDGALSYIPQAVPSNAFLLFSAILFALAGWTGVEPVFRYKKDIGVSDTRPQKGMSGGTLFSAFLYALFVLAIWMSAERITPDALSGLENFVAWKSTLLLLLGLFAIWTSYVPIGIEIKTSLEKDAKIPRLFSLTIVFLVPPLLFLSGLRDFLGAVGLVGGFFLALQYLLIVLVSRKVLRLGWVRRRLTDVVAAAFLLAAGYETYLLLY